MADGIRLYLAEDDQLLITDQQNHALDDSFLLAKRGSLREGIICYIKEMIQPGSIALKIFRDKLTEIQGYTIARTTEISMVEYIDAVCILSLKKYGYEQQIKECLEQKWEKSQKNPEVNGIIGKAIRSNLEYRCRQEIGQEPTLEEQLKKYFFGAFSQK